MSEALNGIECGIKVAQCSDCGMQEFKYMRFLALIYMTFLLAATVCAYKIVKVWFLPEPGSTLIYTFTFFIGNVFTEVYGAQKARKLIWESVICGFIFASLITVINWLPSPNYLNNHDEFNKILGNVLRFTTAGTIGYLTSAFVNVYLLNRWKLKMHGKFFWLRSLSSTIISEFVATFIAGIITFFGMMSINNILYIMLNASIFKILYSFIAVWPASFMAFVLKKKEAMYCESRESSKAYLYDEMGCKFKNDRL